MVIQQGARRNYVIAEHLEKAGMLNALVTDAAWAENAAGPAARLAGRMSPKLAGALRRRTVPPWLPKERLKTRS
jgi:hypothetical protein